VNRNRPEVEQQPVADDVYRRALRLAGAYRAERAAQISALLEEAAALGHCDATYALANWRHFGIGVERDDALAAALWGRASASGHGEAAFQLAVAYERGIGVAQDRVRAYELYTRAAERGIVNALYEIGRCAYYGLGTACDRDRAAASFRDARLAGHAEATADAGEDDVPRRMPPPSFTGPFHATRGGA
jgi:TPR repeat protein